MNDSRIMDVRNERRKKEWKDRRKEARKHSWKERRKEGRMTGRKDGCQQERKI